MAVFKREDLRNQLKRGEIAPVYLLFGPETHLRDLAAKTITDFAFSDGDFRDFNETAFSLNTGGNLALALASAEQLPMRASRRVVRINDIRISTTGFRDTITEDDEPLISAYLANPSPDSVVIFVADELNGVRKMGKFLREKIVAVEFARLNEQEFGQRARKEFSDAGAEIDESTLRYFLSRLEMDVRRLTNEVNKLAAAAMPEKRVTAELIEALVPNSAELSNFDLTDYLVAGKKLQALKTLKKILDDGAEPLALLGLISYNFRRLLIAKEMMDHSAPRADIAKAVKLFGRGQEDFLAAARRANIKKLTYAIKRLAKADLAIKTSIGGGGNAGSRMQIEMLVCELALM